MQRIFDSLSFCLLETLPVHLHFASRLRKTSEALLCAFEPLTVLKKADKFPDDDCRDEYKLTACALS